MKTIKIIALLCAFALLAACAPKEIKHDVEQAIAHDVAVKIQPVAIPDLKNQQVTATAAGDVNGAKCAGASIDLVNGLAAMTPAGGSGKCLPIEFIDPATGKCKAGAATALEAVRIAQLTPAAPQQRPAFVDAWLSACAPVALDLQLSLIDLAAQLGVNIAGFGLGGQVGAAKAISAMQAAHAAQP
jgi:hypothetical protein